MNFFSLDSFLSAAENHDNYYATIPTKPERESLSGSGKDVVHDDDDVAVLCSFATSVPVPTTLLVVMLLYGSRELHPTLNVKCHRSP